MRIRIFETNGICSKVCFSSICQWVVRTSLLTVFLILLMIRQKKCRDCSCCFWNFEKFRMQLSRLRKCPFDLAMRSKNGRPERFLDTKNLFSFFEPFSSFEDLIWESLHHCFNGQIAPFNSPSLITSHESPSSNQCGAPWDRGSIQVDKKIVYYYPTALGLIENQFRLRRAIPATWINSTTSVSIRTNQGCNTWNNPSTFIIYGDQINKTRQFLNKEQPKKF